MRPLNTRAKYPRARRASETPKLEQFTLLTECEGKLGRALGQFAESICFDHSGAATDWTLLRLVGGRHVAIARGEGAPPWCLDPLPPSLAHTALSDYREISERPAAIDCLDAASVVDVRYSARTEAALAAIQAARAAKLEVFLLALFMNRQRRAGALH